MWEHFDTCSRVGGGYVLLEMSGGLLSFHFHSGVNVRGWWGLMSYTSVKIAVTDTVVQVIVMFSTSGHRACFVCHTVSLSAELKSNTKSTSCNCILSSFFFAFVLYYPLGCIERMFV